MKFEEKAFGQAVELYTYGLGRSFLGCKCLLMVWLAVLEETRVLNLKRYQELTQLPHPLRFEGMVIYVFYTVV